jgi:predicted nucleotidyltransferase
MHNRNNKQRETPATLAVFQTLLYSDLFSFPLTKEELWRFLISEKKITKKEFREVLQQLPNAATMRDGYFCLKGKEKTITKREKNLTEVTKKITRAREVAQKLAQIPSIRFIGISGGLAAGSATKDDDIDLVVIVKRNTLFMSRLLILFVLELLGVRRRRGQKDSANTICLNLLFDEEAFVWPQERRDVYTAREIAQIVPLFERNACYQQFLASNEWIQDFLPNSTVRLSSNWFFRRNDTFVSGLVYHLVFHSFFELLAKQIQFALISRHKTKEIVTDHLLAFHPYDYRTNILDRLRLKNQQLGLLTKICILFILAQTYVL